jgi:hypothetical protein
VATEMADEVQRDVEREQAEIKELPPWVGMFGG